MRPAKDWRPKVKRIVSPIAEDFWELEEPGGGRAVARIAVGQPKMIPKDAQKTWYCPVDLGGTIRSAYGVGPVDALMNAMQLVRSYFEGKWKTAKLVGRDRTSGWK